MQMSGQELVCASIGNSASDTVAESLNGLLGSIHIFAEPITEESIQVYYISIESYTILKRYRRCIWLGPTTFCEHCRRNRGRIG